MLSLDLSSCDVTCTDEDVASPERSDVTSMLRRPYVGLTQMTSNAEITKEIQTQYNTHCVPGEKTINQCYLQYTAHYS